MHFEELRNGESAYYILTNLKVKTAYEIRISYPATVSDIIQSCTSGNVQYEMFLEIPTKFIIKDLNTTLSTGRKLLNVEKMVFHIDLNVQKHFEVTAFHTGIPVEASLMEIPVSYDIIVEQLYGGFPFNVWKMVLIALVVVCVILRFCHQPFINYINKETQKLE